MVGFDGEPLLVLVAVDGSASSLRAGAYAVSLARRQDARLVCLYVRTPGVSLTGSVPGVDTVIREAKASVGAELRELVAANAGRLGVDVTFVEASGSPYSEIVRTADELHADAIVVGASTQAGHRVIGSVGARLIRNAHWPVTVVP